ncbi:MAG: electron transfer flavoprotein subunit alpha/FixB family protein [Bacteroidetes bacterium]|nr:electron transfer flavoprotein subunit alpha/FixB family protein [Bacteroidota bacterium]
MIIILLLNMSIVVIVEPKDDKRFSKSAFEAVCFGFQLSQKEKKNFTVITIGDVHRDTLSELAKYGASNMINYSIDQNTHFDSTLYANAVQRGINKMFADIVIFSKNNVSDDVAPHLAARNMAGLATSVVGQPEIVDSGFYVRRNVYSGKAVVKSKISGDLKILTIQPNSIDLVESETKAEITILENGIESADVNTKLISSTQSESKIPLSDAEIVVSGGRGLKGPENWNMLNEMAELLQGAQACSKPVSDSNWRPHSEHVGQTGTKVRPNLYVAVGISGAIQHIAGINGSRCIIAINTDADAPIFKVATYGIIGDAFEIIPKMNDAIKNIVKS